MGKEYENEVCPECGTEEFFALANGVCKCQGCGAIFPLFEDVVDEEEFNRGNSRDFEDEDYD